MLEKRSRLRQGDRRDKRPQLESQERLITTYSINLNARHEYYFLLAVAELGLGDTTDFGFYHPRDSPKAEFPAFEVILIVSKV